MNRTMRAASLALSAALALGLAACSDDDTVVEGEDTVVDETTTDEDTVVDETTTEDEGMEDETMTEDEAVVEGDAEVEGETTETEG